MNERLQRMLDAAGISLEPFDLPMSIEERSLAIIEAEVGARRPVEGLAWEVLRRMIHATADFELLELARFHPRAAEAGLEALLAGGALVCDTTMILSGLPRRRLDPLGVQAHCLMNDPEVGEIAAREGTTRARAAVRVALERLEPTVWVIGNAPTALLELLERLDAGAPAPRLIIGMPVGFVNAAQSKALLAAQDAVPYITIAGRKGGSATAAAACNALAEAALRKTGQA